MAIDPTNKPKLREAIIKFLACRPALAFAADSIAYHIYRDQLICFHVDQPDVDDALLYAVGLGYVCKIDSEISPVYNWQATTKGVQYAERQGLA